MQQKIEEQQAQLHAQHAVIRQLVSRAFAAFEVLADKQADLDDALLTLIEEQTSNQARLWKHEERFDHLSEVIERMINSIGELSRRNN